MYLAELDGELYDGIFDNSRIGYVEEIEPCKGKDIAVKFIFILAFLGGLFYGYFKHITASEEKRKQQTQQTAEHAKGLISGVIVGSAAMLANVVKNARKKL